MFPRRFFASRYFTLRYWAQSLGLTPVYTPPAGPTLDGAVWLLGRRTPVNVTIKDRDTIMTDFPIVKGSTFIRVLRWESAPLVYTPITAISKAAPAVVTSAAHGLVDGWRATVVSAGGMRQINAKNSPPKARDFHKITYVGTNQISFNDIDSSNFTAYTSGGYLCSYTPVSLANYTARMKIRAAASSPDVLVSVVSGAGITLDDTNHTITITLSAADTAAYTFASGVFDLELVSGDATPVVTKLLSGTVTVLDEVTY